jgi:hypothetical protein
VADDAAPQTVGAPRSPRAFKAFTSAMPIGDSRCVFINGAGFACTIREKLAMLRDNTRKVYAAWPGQHETHAFEVDRAEAKVLLAEAALEKAGL